MPDTRLACDDCESMCIALARTYDLPMPDDSDFIKPKAATESG